MNETRERAKEVLCMILAASEGELKKKVALYKAFYYAHLYYWKIGQGTLTDYPIVRMPQGPGIDEGNSLLEELEAEGKIRIERENYGPYTEYAFSLVEAYPVDRNSLRYRAIDSAVDFVREKSAAELSQITHDYSRSWQEANNGDELNIYLDLLDEDEYSLILKQSREAEEMIAHAFS